MSPAALLAQKDAENARLRAELAATRAEFEAFRIQQGAAFAELTAAVARANERISELLAMAQRKKAGKAPSPPSEPGVPPEVSAEAKAALEDRPAPPEERGPLYDHPRPRQGRPGRNPLPSHLARTTTTSRPETCRCGCGDFDWVDEVVEEKLDVRAHQRVRVTRRATGRCRRCGERTTGEAPPSPFERSKVTCEWLAWCIAQKFELHVALDRLRRSLTAQGLPLSISFFVAMVEAAADLLAPIDGVHWKQLLAGGVLESDGTGLKVQVPGAGLHHGFLEVYHHGGTVVFQYEPEKGGETQAAKLAGFTGRLLVDAESRYNQTIRTNSGILEYNCNAHPRRKLKDAEAAHPVLAAEAGRFVSAMFELEAHAKTQGLVGDRLLAWRQDQVKPVYDQFGAWIDAVKPTLPLPSDPLGKVLQYYVNHWVELRRFLQDPRVPIDNSASERQFQAVAKLRLNSLFAGGTEGAHRAAVLLGITATCRNLAVDLQDYLTWVFVRRGTHRHKYPLTAEQLTPAAYKHWRYARAP